MYFSINNVNRTCDKICEKKIFATLHICSNVLKCFGIKEINTLSAQSNNYRTSNISHFKIAISVVYQPDLVTNIYMTSKLYKYTV